MIYKDNQYATNKCSFRCSNTKCRKKYPITINSFYTKFSRQKLFIISEILKCFLLFDFNAKKTREYINTQFDENVSGNVISKVYKEIRVVICKYLKISYQSNLLADKNQNKYLSVDESLITHVEGKQVWLLGIIDNANKDFVSRLLLIEMKIL